MAHKPAAVRPTTADIGPGQYYRDAGVGSELGITIPKSGRGAFYEGADNKLGPGQYDTATSSINRNTGVSFKGHCAALDLA